MQYMKTKKSRWFVKKNVFSKRNNVNNWLFADVCSDVPRYKSKHQTTWPQFF